MRTGREDSAPLWKSRVLVAAYACNPKRGSEEAVGWNWVQAIAESHEVTVLTAAFNEADIRSVCDPETNPRFVFVPHRRWHYAPTPRWKRIEGSAAKPIMNMAYVAWQREAHAVALRLTAGQSFDLVHQLTYVGFRFPGQLWRLGLPFVWGPLGGFGNTPWSLLRAMGASGAVYHGVRNVVNSAQKRWQRTPKRAAVAAGPGLIAATEGIAQEVQRRYGVGSTVICEVTAPVELSPKYPNARFANEPLRIVWSGLHLPRKALNIFLQGLSRVRPEFAWELHVLGDGPRERVWQGLADSLGIADRCLWYGQIPRREALDVMARGHVLAISSLEDLTSTVLLEGLALGLPVICPDHCGFSNVVTQECGVKIPPASIESLVAGFASAVESLASNEPRRYRMAQVALRRARDYSPEVKRRQINEVYERVLERHGRREATSEG